VIILTHFINVGGNNEEERLYGKACWTDHLEKKKWSSNGKKKILGDVLTLILGWQDGKWECLV